MTSYRGQAKWAKPMSPGAGGILKGESITVPLTSCLTGFELTVGQLTFFFCFYLQNRSIQTGQAGGQRYSDTSPFSIPWKKLKKHEFLPLDPSSIICPGSSPYPCCIELGPAFSVPSNPSAEFDPPK